MTDTYNDTTGSRKKFLIPLVVLLLCAVSLTGAGYAYNSSVQTANAPAEGDIFVVNTYDENHNIAMIPTDEDDGVVVFTTETVYATNAQQVTAGTATVKANAASAQPVLLGSIYFKVTADTGADTAYAQVSGNMVATKVATAQNLTDEQKTAVAGLVDSITLTVEVYAEADLDHALTPSQAGDYTVNVGGYYKAELYAQFTGQAVPVGSNIAVDDDPTVETVAGYFKAAFDLVEYNIAISASDAPTA